MSIETALSLALKAHAGQFDKAGKPYILHPLRLMLQFADETRQTVALLHDVLEDSSTTTDDLRAAGFSDEIIEAVIALTRQANESYEAFIQRVKHNDIARSVKLADLADNLDLTRLTDPSEVKPQRIARYIRALADLRLP